MKRQLVFLLTVLIISSLFQPSISTAQDEDGASFFITDDGSYSVRLPDGWFASGDRETGLLVGNYESILTGDVTSSLDSGSVTIRTEAMSRAEADTLTEVENASLVDILDIRVEIMHAQIQEMETRPDVREIEFLGRTMATAVVTLDDLEIMVVIYEIAPDTFNYVSIIGPIGMVNEQGKRALEIVDSIRYSLALDDTFDDGTFAFHYPVGWIVEKELTDIIYVANFEEVLEITDLIAGQYAVAILDPSFIGVYEANVENTAEELAIVLQPESDEAIVPSVLTVGGQEISFVEVSLFGTSTNSGGVMVKETGQGFVTVIYVASTGESERLWLTALNILLSIE